MLAFVLAIAAGFACRYVEEPLVGALEKVLLDKIDIKKEDALALSYAVCLLIVGVLVALSSAEVSAFAILLGGLLGLFGTEIVAAIRKAAG
ncbi:MAG: hypothetical protein AAFP13_16070 [Pseudomonadota bacterium]